MDNELIYLDTYVLQQDMRIRMPKSILENLDLEKGKSMLKIYYDPKNSNIILRKSGESITTERANGTE